MLPVPDHPAVIECRRSIGILEPSDALGQHDFFGKHRTVDEQMPSASRVVEVRAQEHCDYASVVKAQGAFDELPRQSIGWIGDDRVDTRLRCLSQEVHALSDVASDHVETSLLERLHTHPEKWSISTRPMSDKVYQGAALCITAKFVCQDRKSVV